MTVSIQTDESGRVTTMYQGPKEGSEWTQLSDSAVPEVTENNVSVQYYLDGSSMTVQTEAMPEDDELF